MSIDSLDWRVDAVSTLEQDLPPASPGGHSFKAGDLVYLTTLARTSKGEIFSFAAPNVSAMALNIAFSAARSANELRQQISYQTCSSQWGTAQAVAPDQLETLFAFIENCIVCVTFSFQALEAFCNYSISRNWRKPIEIKRKKKKELLNHEETERQLSTEEKLKSVLPKIYNKPTPAGKAIWERFIEIKKARDSCIHIKYRDQCSNGQTIDEGSLFFHFLGNDPTIFPSVAKEMITYFYAQEDRPRWMQHLPS